MEYVRQNIPRSAHQASETDLSVVTDRTYCWFVGSTWIFPLLLAVRKIRLYYDFPKNLPLKK